jgi:RimJ/RimL family protein N-acetyltransferase
MSFDAPWSHPSAAGGLFQLVQVPIPVIHALANDKPALAQHLSPVFLTPHLLGPACRGLWRMRSAQIAANPSDAVWVTRFVIAPDSPSPVGLAGFHGAPDSRHTVEVGYRIDPERRRRGHARRALETLLATARAEPTVHVVRATVSPENVASRNLIDQYGFVEVGEQWDEEDGLEIVLERPATA